MGGLRRCGSLTVKLGSSTADKEVWRVAFHREDAKDKHTGSYTTRPAGTIVLPEEKKEP